MYSRGFSNEESEISARMGGGAGGSSRYVGTREWSKAQQHSSSRLTAASTEDGSPWSGPGRDLDNEKPTTHGHNHHTGGGGGISGGRGAGRMAAAAGYAGHEVEEEFQPYPLGQDASKRSCLSHDLSGFSDYDAPQKASDLAFDAWDSEDVPGRGEAGYGAAAAAAAERTNQRVAAAKAKAKAKAAAADAAAIAGTAGGPKSQDGSGSGRSGRSAGGVGGGNGSTAKKNSRRPNRPPMPNGAGGATVAGAGGETKEGKATSDAKVNGVEVSAFHYSTL